MSQDMAWLVLMGQQSETGQQTSTGETKIRQKGQNSKSKLNNNIYLPIFQHNTGQRCSDTSLRLVERRSSRVAVQLHGRRSGPGLTAVVVLREGHHGAAAVAARDRRRRRRHLQEHVVPGEEVADVGPAVPQPARHPGDRRAHPGPGSRRPPPQRAGQGAPDSRPPQAPAAAPPPPPRHQRAVVGPVRVLDGGGGGSRTRRRGRRMGRRGGGGGELLEPVVGEAAAAHGRQVRRAAGQHAERAAV
jgi:hypothetical protein